MILSVDLPISNLRFLAKQIEPKSWNDPKRKRILALCIIKKIIM